MTCSDVDDPVNIAQLGELAPEEREVYKTIFQQQLEEKEKENVYPHIDLCAAYHSLRGR